MYLVDWNVECVKGVGPCINGSLVIFTFQSGAIVSPVRTERPSVELLSLACMGAGRHSSVKSDWLYTIFNPVNYSYQRRYCKKVEQAL